MKEYVHIKWLDREIKLQMLPDSGDYSDGYARLFDTILKAMSALECKESFDEYFPSMDSLDVQFFKKEQSHMDSAELPHGMKWYNEVKVPVEKAMSQDVYYRIVSNSKGRYDEYDD